MRSGRWRRCGIGRVATTALVASLFRCGEGAPAREGAPVRRWLDPVLLETYDGTASSPALSLDAQGDALVLWQQDGTDAGLWTHRLLSGRWTGAEPVQLGEGVGFEPQIASNESGVIPGGSGISCPSTFTSTGRGGTER